MIRLFVITVGLLGGWYTPGASAAEWALERVELLDGRRYQGLIESEDESWVNLIQIRRPPGRRAYLVIRPIDRASVAAVVRLKPRQRAKLRRWIDQFVRHTQIEAGRMQAIRLDIVTESGKHYLRYRGKWFTLLSNLDEPTTRRIIVRTEQVFIAYRRILAARTESSRPLRFVVLGSMSEYRAYLERFGLRIQNPACFIEEENLVVAGSQYTRLAAQLEKIKAQHDQILADLDRLEKHLSTGRAELARQLRQQGTPKAEIAKLLAIESRKFTEEIKNKRNELKVCSRQNARMFDQITRQMFTRLYHEAFHAYLENYVYPHDKYDVPRWLNEGQAVMFEGGLLESDTLRVDAPNREALQRLKADLADGRPLPLAELLAADAQAFLLPSGADRYYAYSWGLAYYLAFERRRLGSPALQQYVQQSAKAAGPVERFERFVGVPLEEFEAAWQNYILKLH